jgi:hypothetical protein
MDTCDPAIGCVHNPIPTSDNNACTIDTCDPVKGIVHTPIVCNDNNLCTNDSCDPATGKCVFTPKCAAPNTCDTATGNCIPACSGLKYALLRGGGQKATGADLQIQTSFTVMNGGCITAHTASSLTCTPGTVLQVNVRAGKGPQPTSCTWQGNAINTDKDFTIVCGTSGILNCTNKAAAGGKDTDNMTISGQ